MKKLIFYSLLTLSLFAVPSCGSDKEDEPIIAVTGLNLDYTSITIEEGDTFTLTATVLPDNATDKTVLWTTGDASVATVSDGIVSALKGGVSWITAKAGDKIARCEVTVKPLNLYVAKAFSVSETKQVFFSSGNLQYHCKNKKWLFASLQYDCKGYDNKNISDGYDGYIDLFGWGTGSNPTLVSENADDYATFIDWGSKIDGGNVWRTLSSDEWTYIIRIRADASAKCFMAEVAGVEGLVLLPDDWEFPKGLSFNHQYLSDDWQKMESAGAVFLPAAGRRVGTWYSGVWSFWSSYWSSSADDTHTDRALSLNFDDMRVYNSARPNGHSVRLVRAAQ